MWEVVLLAQCAKIVKYINSCSYPLISHKKTSEFNYTRLLRWELTCNYLIVVFAWASVMDKIANAITKPKISHFWLAFFIVKKFDRWNYVYSFSCKLQPIICTTSANRRHILQCLWSVYVQIVEKNPYWFVFLFSTCCQSSTTNHRHWLF